MTNTSNLFGGLRDAKIYSKGIFLKPGCYEVRVNNAVYKETRKNFDAYILEFTIEKSNYEEAKTEAIRSLGSTPFSLQDFEKTLPNRVGTTASWFQSLQDEDIGFGALKLFAANILDQNVDDADFLDSVETFLTSTVKDRGAILDGSLIPIEAVMIMTKKNTPFTLHKFGKILEQGPNLVEALGG